MSNQRWSRRKSLCLIVGFNIIAWLGIATCAKADGIADINTQANQIQPHADASLPDGTYDCEDYAQAKINALIAAGYGYLNPVMWYVRTETGEAHAIVVLSDGRVLDNRYRGVQSARSLSNYTGYRFLFPTKP